MKSLRTLTLIGASMALFSVNSFADLVIPNPAGSFTALNGAALNQAGGGGFFDNVSIDNDGFHNSKCNIGYLLTGLQDYTKCKNSDVLPDGTLAGGADLDGNTSNNGDMSGVPTGNFYEYLNNGGASTGWELQASATGTATTLHIEIAEGPQNYGLGYCVGNTSNCFQLYGPATTGVVSQLINVNAGETFFFYLNDVLNAKTYYSNTPFGAEPNRFALFRDTTGGNSGMNVNRYVLAVENGNSGLNVTPPDFDYNDFILTAQVVPEPSSVIVLSGAVVATLAMMRRRKKA